MKEQMMDLSSILIEDEYELVDIESIEEKNGDYELYDMDVEEDHTYCITNENIISHNCKSMLRVLSNKCAKTGTTFVFSNHTYDNPASLFPSLIQNQSGGKAPIYLASVLVQLALKQEKNDSKADDKEIIPIANRVNGISMRALTIKNRFVPPFLETTIYLNFKSGLYKYAGLLEMALAYNVIQQNGPIYSLADEKLGYYKNWKDDKELWEERIIPKLDKILEKELCFSKIGSDNEIEYDENEELNEE